MNIAYNNKEEKENNEIQIEYESESPPKILKRHGEGNMQIQSINEEKLMISKKCTMN